MPPYVHREYPKWITGPAGPVIVGSLEEERTTLGIAATDPTEAPGPKPAPGSAVPLPDQNLYEVIQRPEPEWALSGGWHPGMPVKSEQDHAD